MTEDIYTKGQKREDKRNKAHNGEYQGVRYNTLRAGEGLINKIVKEKTKLKKEKNV